MKTACVCLHSNLSPLHSPASFKHTRRLPLIACVSIGTITAGAQTEAFDSAEKAQSRWHTDRVHHLQEPGRQWKPSEVGKLVRCASLKHLRAREHVWSGGEEVGVIFASWLKFRLHYKDSAMHVWVGGSAGSTGPSLFGCHMYLLTWFGSNELSDLLSPLGPWYEVAVPSNRIILT